MSNLSPEFNAAVEASKSLANKPDNDTLLKLYGLYKQASAGDVSSKRPGFTDPVGRAKWDAYNSYKGLSSEQAQTDYIALVNSLS